MDDSKNRPRIAVTTAKQWFEKAVMPKGSKDDEDLKACLRDLGITDYDEIDVVRERFNVRALPYAFTEKSPLVPLFTEIALQHDADSTGEPVVALASDSALGGSESMFVLYIQYIDTAVADFEALPTRGPVARDASMFRTATLELDDGFEMRITGLHAVTCRQDQAQ